ncbi:MAG TPA: TetR/AcrR family transcriptional regulator [Pseudonocardiaceae bacterium]|nr:TetR/AcrR family transcriptional regulator [Pseudonocardiaceae bacterium]
MTGTRPKVDTKSRIQAIALELFAEQGYEKTSLREIAERLGVTKAALYYHFKTKEDIVASLFDDFLSHVDEITEWARNQVVDEASRKEVVRRYAQMLNGPGEAVIQFVHGNQSAVRDLKDSDHLFERFRELSGLLTDSAAPLTTQLKNSMALPMLHIGYFGPFELNASTQERRAAALDVALELVSSPSTED